MVLFRQVGDIQLNLMTGNIRPIAVFGFSYSSALRVVNCHMKFSLKGWLSVPVHCTATLKASKKD